MQEGVQLSSGWMGLQPPKACVIGLGLIGGSWAGALHAQGWTVFAVDTDLASLEEARKRGWIEAGWPEIPAYLDVDLVILALPLHLLEHGLKLLLGRLPSGSIVTDTGSIKGQVCPYTLEFLKHGIFFIGGHPMTGSEKSGFAAADPGLFVGYPYVLTPLEECPRLATEELAKLLEKLGAKVVWRESGLHDRHVALVSHVPHLLAVALAQAAGNRCAEGISPSPLELAGRSFRELTRIADSSPEMWKEIMVRNAPAILDGLELWQAEIDKLREFVRNRDGDGIAEAFRQARRVRQLL